MNKKPDRSLPLRYVSSISALFSEHKDSPRIQKTCKGRAVKDFDGGMATSQLFLNYTHFRP